MDVVRNSRMVITVTIRKQRETQSDDEEVIRYSPSVCTVRSSSHLTPVTLATGLAPFLQISMDHDRTA